MIQILLRLCLTLVLLTKTLLRHHPLRDFVSALYNYTQPSEFCTFLICIRKRRALISQNHRFPSHNRYVSTLSCTSCGGVGNEAVIGWAPLLARKTFHENICTSGLQFWKWRAVDSGRDGWVTNTRKPIFRCITRWTYSCVERYGYCIHTTSCWVDTTLL